MKGETLFGLEQLDALLADLPEQKNILIAGPQASGASVLATQAAVRVVKQGGNVYYSGKAFESAHVVFRFLAADAGEEVETVMRWKGEKQLAATRELFGYVGGPANPDQLQVVDLDLDELLDLMEGLIEADPTRSAPDLLVVDRLNFREAGAGPRNLDHLVDRLLKFGRTHRCTIIATARVMERAKGGTSVVSPAMLSGKWVHRFDAFLGISNRHVTLRDQELDPLALLSEKQFINAVTTAEDNLVPVLQDFEHCRFLPGDHDADRNGLDPVTGETLEELTAAVEANTVHAGWVPLYREDLEKVLRLRHPPYLAVYVALALRANQDGARGLLGVSRPGREALVRCTGLTEMIVRGALAKLRKVGAIEQVGESQRRQATKWLIPSVKRGVLKGGHGGFFRLHKNLMDHSRADLRKDPLKLAIWLNCFLLARFRPDSGAGLNSGEFWVVLQQFLEVLPRKTTREEVARILKGFVNRGSLRNLNVEGPVGDGDFLRITNWAVYQA